MLVPIESRRFPTFRAAKQRFDNAHLSLGMDVYRAINLSTDKALCPHKRTLLSFFNTLTYACGREGAQVYVYQFEKGVVRAGTDTLICAGVNMSDKTWRKHLRELCELGYVTIYAAKVRDTAYENDARVFEIDCKKLLGDRKEGGSKTYHPGVVKLTPHHRSIKGIDKSILLAGGENLIDGESNEETEMLKQPKRGAWQAPKQNDLSPTAVVAQIKAGAVARSTVRQTAAQAKPAHTLNKEELQAVIDQQMRMYQPKAPRMLVTNREHGFLRKRLADAPPDNLTNFIGWALRYWSDIATQSRKAALKREAAGQARSTPMVMSPNFATLAYRYPYLLKAYGNFSAERATAMDEQIGDNSRVESLEAEINRLRQNVQTLRKAKTARTVESVPTPRGSVARVGQAERFESDLPEWDAPIGEQNAKRA